MEEHETATKVVDEKSTEELIKDKSDKSPTSSGPSWWGSWISQAKEKSASVLEAVKNDLNEITTAVTETLSLAPTEEELSEEANQKENPNSESDASVNFNQVKQSISSSISQFFGTVTDALIPQLDEDDTSEAVLISKDETIVLTGFVKHLKELQENDETYLEEPSKTAEYAEKYRMWLEIVEQDQFTQPRIEKMLEQSHVLNEKYNKFVPDTVSHMNFFKRYLFKKALLEDELANEERRRKEAEIIRKQPESTIETTTESKNEKPQVEDVEMKNKKKKINETASGDLELANFELSEEEQARLLEAYEQEIKEREKKESPEKPAKSVKSQKSAKKSNVQSKSATVKGKNNKDLKNQPQKSTQQQKTTKNQQKSAAKEAESSTSDESWEKDFEM